MRKLTSRNCLCDRYGRPRKVSDSNVVWLAGFILEIYHHKRFRPVAEHRHKVRQSHLIAKNYDAVSRDGLWGIIRVTKSDDLAADQHVSGYPQRCSPPEGGRGPIGLKSHDSAAGYRLRFRWGPPMRSVPSQPPKPALRNLGPQLHDAFSFPPTRCPNSTAERLCQTISGLYPADHSVDGSKE